MRAINDGQKTLSAIKEEMIKVRFPFYYIFAGEV